MPVGSTSWNNAIRTITSRIGRATATIKIQRSPNLSAKCIAFSPLCDLSSTDPMILESVYAGDPTRGPNSISFGNALICNGYRENGRSVSAAETLSLGRSVALLP